MWPGPGAPGRVPMAQLRLGCWIMGVSTDLLTPTAAETKLIRAAAEDSEADLCGHRNGQQPVIRAEMLRTLCTGACPKWPVKNRIRMTGGRVRSHLDLSGAHLAHALHFTRCVFEDRVDLTRARADKPVEWDGGHIDSILADHFSSETDLAIRNVTAAGLICLQSAWVRGDVKLSGSQLSPRGGQAICGDHLRVGGTLFLDGEDFHARGEVDLRSARIEGQLDCRHASFSNPPGHSINADHIVVGGDVLLEDGFCADGEVCLQWARVGRLRATGGNFTSTSTYALHADALRAASGVYLDRGFHATATVRLVGANIIGELCCTQGSFRDPTGRALDAERIVAEDVYLDGGFTARGEVRFNDSQVSRQFNATQGKFQNDRSGAYALDCDGLLCGGDVFLNGGFRAEGTVSLTGAEIKSELNCSAGSFITPGGYALFADGMTTQGTVYLDQGFRAMGEVRFARATIGRQLVCTGGLFDNQHGLALDLTGLITPGDVLANEGFRATGEVRLRNADITRDLDFSSAQLHGKEGLDGRGIKVGGRLTWKMDQPPEGLVNLSSGQVSRLDDTMPAWLPGSYMLAGLSYRPTMDGEDQVTVDQRIAWLRNTKCYAGTAYQQLAEAYRLSGQESTAEKVSIASLQDLRKRGNLRRRARKWNKFLDWTVGYGYRLHRPFLALLVLGLLGALFYYLGEHAGLIYATQDSKHGPANGTCSPGYPCFNPIVYSFQMLIPGLDLREATYWWPDASKAPWGFPLVLYTWLMIILGWVLATAIVAGITQLFRRR
jgi:hypothetical protein